MAHFVASAPLGSGLGDLAGLSERRRRSRGLEGASRRPGFGLYDKNGIDDLKELTGRNLLKLRLGMEQKYVNQIILCQQLIGV
jgi:hypothetical protein